jgi:hypothetical protein
VKAAAVLPAIVVFLPAVLLSARPGRGSRIFAGTIDAGGLLLIVLLWSAPGADPFRLFVGAMVLGAVLLATVVGEPDADSLGRLHLGGSLAVVAASTPNVIWPLSAVLLMALLTTARWTALLVPALAALGGAALTAASHRQTGLALVAFGLPTLWILASRELLRNGKPRLTTRVSACFVLLLAMSAALLHAAASFPASAPLGATRALAVAALALAALGALGSTRVTTFLTAFALARGGLALLALSLGAQGRLPSLLSLAVSGVSLVLLAATLDDVDALDDVRLLASTPRRLLLTWAALSSASFPPFAGSFLLFPLASGLLDRGHVGTLLAAAALQFLLLLGAFRVVVRAWEEGEPRSRGKGLPRVALALALVATVALSISPAALVEIARVAAL